MNNENNQDMRSGDIEQGAQIAGNAAKKAGSAAKNKTKEAIGNKIRRAKTLGDRPGQKVGTGKKIKGKAIEAKGKGKTALGGAITGAGLGNRVAGLGTRAAAQGIKGAGTLLGLIPYAGPAIKATLEAVAKTMDTAGKQMDKFGKKMTQKGKKQIKSGMHDIKRGRMLAKTGQDIGPKGAGALGGIPNAPGAPQMPNIAGIVGREKRRANMKKMLDPKSFLDPATQAKRKVKLLIILGVVIFVLVLILVLMVTSNVNDGKYVEGDYSNVPFVISEEVMSNLVIVSDENGKYKYAFKNEEGDIIELDEAIDNALETLRKNGCNALVDMGNDDGKRKELLTKLIKAEIATQYPALNVTTSRSMASAGDYCVDTSGVNNTSSGIIDSETSNDTNTSTEASHNETYDYAAWLTHVSYNGWGGYLTHHGYATKKDSSTTTITDDGKSYYVQDINGVYSAGMGVNLSANKDSFAKYGVDISECKVGDTIDADIVEVVSSDDFFDNITSVNSQAKKKGITLTENQAQALASVKYSGGNINKFWELYDQYGDLDEAAEHFNNASGCGTESFYTVDKNITGDELDELKSREGADVAKSASRYLIFKYGIYRSGSKNFDKAVQDIINKKVVIGKNATVNVSGVQDAGVGEADISAFLEIAEQMYVNISNNKLPYNQYGGRRDPKVYLNDNLAGYSIDCSSYVSAVLYAFDSEKYSRFANQQTTHSFYPYAEEWAEEYGWTTFMIDESTTIDDLMPGDIVVIHNPNGPMHIQILAEPVDPSDPRSDMYVYDCGGHENWLWSSDYHDGGNKNFWKRGDANVSAKVIRLNDVGGGGVASFVDDGSLQGRILINRKTNSSAPSSNIPSGSGYRTLKYIDEESFNQKIVSGSSDAMNYYTLKKGGTANSPSNSFGGTDILNDWVASWENGALFLYKKGQGSYGDAYVKGYITEDGKNYICRTDEGTGNGTMNYGFGVCIYNPNESGGWMHVESFAKYGVDVTQSVLNQTQVAVDIVDKVKAEELQKKYDYIKNKTSSAGLNLSENEINALAGIAYQFGDGGANLDSFINLYKQYGNTEALKESYQSSGGTYLFKKVMGGTNSEGIDRAAANWGLFHDGIYYAGSGGRLDKNAYSSSGSATTSSSSATGAVSDGPITVDGVDNKTKCWNFLTQTMGYSDPVAAGVMGNMQAESGFDPQADNGSHYGLIQWSKTFCPEVNGKSLEEQFAFFRKWMSTGEFDQYGGNYKSGFTYDQFLNMTDAGQVARAFGVVMERFGGGPECAECTKRAGYAEEILAEFGGTSAGSAARVASLDNFVFIGDSRYDGNSNIASLGSNIKNAGVGSSNINEWIKVIENGGKGTVQGRSVDVSGSYAGVSVQLGANGVYNNVANTASQMKTLIEKLKVLYPNTPIFINSCMQVSPKAASAGYSWNASTFRDNVTEFNTDIANYCGQVENVYYVDISENLYDSENFIKDEYTSDGLHCNGEGQKVFANNIKNGILNTSASAGSSQTDSATSNGDGYMLVVADKNTVTTSVVEEYSYSHTAGIDTLNGSNFTASRLSQTPAPQTVRSSQTVSYSTTSVDYQTPLKQYTLYFDFLWAILINSGDRDLVMSWADLALSSKVYITVFNEESSTVSTNTQSKGVTTRSSYNDSNKSAIVDYYNVTEKSTITNTTIKSKVAITNADTWLINYNNNAATYSEYQGRSKEEIVEKIDPDAEGDNIIKLLQKNKSRLRQLAKEKYLVDRMIEDNEKVKFMSEIYEYVLNVARGKNVKANKEKLINGLDTSKFDLSSTSTVTERVLKYTSLTINDSDKELLYKFVEKVGEDCSNEEKEYITCVILNRALTGKFGGNKISKVIKKSHQFENFNASSLNDVEPSDETKSIVDGIISSGDKSKYSIYYATYATAEKKNWDNDSRKKATVSGDKYKFYTTSDAEKQLKKYEVTVSVNTGSAAGLGASDLASRMVAWAEQWVGKSTFETKQGTSVAKNYCARFIRAAYEEVGLEAYPAPSAKDLPHPNPIKYNSDGTVDWSEIPVGAIMVSKGTGQHGHVCLYIGNGYVIEAGGDVVSKSSVDESFAGKGHNCAPFIGWGFATEDQELARQKLVTASGNYQTGWTDMTATAGEWGSSSGTGIQGVFNAGDKTYTVFSQSGGPWANVTAADGGYTYTGGGCYLTCMAIIASGYGNNVTPVDFYGAGTVQSYLQPYGLQCRNVSSMSEIVEELKKGNPVIYHTNSGNIGGHYYSRTHWVTLLAVNEKGEIFLGDPGCTRQRSGWFTQDKFTGLAEAYAISK